MRWSVLGLRALRKLDVCHYVANCSCCIAWPPFLPSPACHSLSQHVSWGKGSSQLQSVKGSNWNLSVTLGHYNHPSLCLALSYLLWKQDSVTDSHDFFVSVSRCIRSLDLRQSFVKSEWTEMWSKERHRSKEGHRDITSKEGKVFKKPFICLLYMRFFMFSWI